MIVDSNKNLIRRKAHLPLGNFHDIRSKTLNLVPVSQADQGIQQIMFDYLLILSPCLCAQNFD